MCFNLSQNDLDISETEAWEKYVALFILNKRNISFERK